MLADFSLAAMKADHQIFRLYSASRFLMYVISLYYSASISSVQAVCYEFAVEMTYPLSEGVSAGLINFTSQVGVCVCVNTTSINLYNYYTCQI